METKPIKETGYSGLELPDTLTKHLQLVEETFNSSFMNNGVNGILDDKFQDKKMMLVKDFLISQIRTAVENDRNEIKDDLLKIADAGELEELRREITNYFK